MKKSWVYLFIMTTSLLSLLLFGGGFLWGIQNLMSSSASPLPTLPLEPVREGEKLNLVALGDSLSRGIGDSEGVGYVGLLRESLSQKGEQEVQITNLSVSGATSTDLLKQLSSKGALRVIAQADLIMFTIGGNDLFRGAGDLQEINPEKLNQGQQQFKANLSEILNALRRVNVNAPIYMMGLYNPFGDLEQSEETTRIVFEWNFQVQLLSLSHESVTFVPVADIFQGELDQVLYSDHFHPNHEGYRRISNRLLDLIDPSLNPLFGEGAGS
jgi:lysophospholipase L1-like esterase